MLTKTIAILTGQEECPLELLKVLGEQKLQLLFVCSDQQRKLRLTKQFEELDTQAELDFISCEKEGCWEADVIILYQPAEFSSEIIERIREVATQKTVLVVSQGQSKKDTHNFEALLPHSKVIAIELAELSDGNINSYFELTEHRISEISGHQ